MFLLSRLETASRQFPHHVADLRAFLLDRGIPAGAPSALPHVSARLATDPSFRRDVSSLMQAVVQSEGETIDYVDLLGILVAAAAGPGPLEANAEQEESVREMLRFLTHIPRPNGAVRPVFVPPQTFEPPQTEAAPTVAIDVPRADVPRMLVREEDYVPTVVPAPSFALEPEESSRRPAAAIWIACLLALVVIGVLSWIYTRAHTSTTETAGQPSSAAPVVDNEQSEPGMEAPAVEHTRARRDQSVARSSTAPVTHARTPHRQALAGSRMAANSTPSVAAPQPVPSAKASVPAKPVVTAESRPIANRAPATSSRNTPPNARPENTEIAAASSVRRRLPKYVVINPELSRQPRANSSPGPVTGVVHPASIGMMATNLISSPTPDYPPAASQAHVEGEVRVRAVVDREGNVINARVVSGPELLRDASLQAVQHWRFRPYLRRGEPVEVATTAVLDFELQ